MKHPGTHQVVAMYRFGWNSGSRHKFQVFILEGCQGEIINLLTMRKCRMVCNLCCIVFYFLVSFFRRLWVKLSDTHISVQQGFEVHVYGL